LCWPHIQPYTHTGKHTQLRNHASHRRRNTADSQNTPTATVTSRVRLDSSVGKGVRHGNGEGRGQVVVVEREESPALGLRPPLRFQLDGWLCWLAAPLLWGLRFPYNHACIGYVTPTHCARSVLSRTRRCSVGVAVWIRMNPPVSVCSDTLRRSAQFANSGWARSCFCALTACRDGWSGTGRQGRHLLAPCRPAGSPLQQPSMPR
jgi:hypothetical protein